MTAANDTSLAVPTTFLTCHVAALVRRIVDETSAENRSKLAEQVVALLDQIDAAAGTRKT